MILDMCHLNDCLVYSTIKSLSISNIFMKDFINDHDHKQQLISMMLFVHFFLLLYSHVVFFFFLTLYDVRRGVQTYNRAPH